MTLLHIDSSPLGDASVSRRLSAKIVARWRQAEPDLVIVRRDLAVAPPAHLGADTMAARLGKPETLTARQREEGAITDALIEDFLAADSVVIGAPMYNFSIASQLKAWIDRIVVAGRTFAYTDKGPVGLAGGKRVVVVSSRGGVYSSGAAQALDFQEAYLKGLFGFLGITDVAVIRAEGLSVPAARDHALDGAAQAIEGLFSAAASPSLATLHAPFRVGLTR